MIPRPSLWVSLVIVALIPLVVALVISSTVVFTQVSSRRQAVSARQSSLVLDSLLRARVSIYQEYVASAAIVAAQANHLTVAQLDALLGTNFPAELARARRQVNSQAAFGPRGEFASSYAQLVALRKTVDQKTATPLGVETYFNESGHEDRRSVARQLRPGPEQQPVDGLTRHPDSTERTRVHVHRLHLGPR